MSATLSMPGLDSPPPAESFLPEVIHVDGWPLLYEDDWVGDMGESNLYVSTDMILLMGLTIHMRETRPALRVFSNMNLYYPRRLPTKVKPPPYISPDLMIVEPTRDLGEEVRSYEIDADGPEPLCITEILSERTAQQRDLDEKPILLAKLRVPEYVLVDPAGEFLEQRLSLRRLRSNGSWEEFLDQDGGVTSHLGFRLLFEPDGKLRVLDAASGRRYLRPLEAEAALDEAKLARASAEAARDAAEAKAKQLEAEVAWLKSRLDPPGC